MKKIIFILLLLLLQGCSVLVPVKPKFPTAPESILVPCTPLQRLEANSKLSDVAKSVTSNYTTYHECVIKHDALTEWYKKQKQIYEGIK